jgi:hypothetical protein
LVCRGKLDRHSTVRRQEPPGKAYDPLGKIGAVATAIAGSSNSNGGQATPGGMATVSTKLATIILVTAEFQTVAHELLKFGCDNSKRINRARSPQADPGSASSPNTF